MKKLFKFIFIPVCLFCIGLALWNFNKRAEKLATDKGIELIKEHTNSAGRIVDYNGVIGVKSRNDIKLYVTEKEIKIQYGKICLTWTPNSFLTKEYDIPLGQIGITRQINPRTGELEVYYQKELLERWAS